MPRTLVPDPANSQSANNAPRILSQQVYPLHRLVLSRSPYFSVLMRGPWKDATSPTLTLEIEDPMVDEAAIEVALGFLYEKVPEELTPELATRTLAAASFLDLQDLCEMCVDVIVNDIRTKTLSEYVKLTTLNQYKTVHDDLLGPDYTRNDKTTSPYGKHSDKIQAKLAEYDKQHEALCAHACCSQPPDPRVRVARWGVARSTSCASTTSATGRSPTPSGRLAFSRRPRS